MDQNRLGPACIPCPRFGPTKLLRLMAEPNTRPDERAFADLILTKGLSGLGGIGMTAGAFFGMKANASGKQATKPIAPATPEASGKRQGAMPRRQDAIGHAGSPAPPEEITSIQDWPLAMKVRVAAKAMGISATALGRLIDNGLIQAIQYTPRGDRMITRSEIQRCLDLLITQPVIGQMGA